MATETQPFTPAEPQVDRYDGRAQNIRELLKTSLARLAMVGVLAAGGTFAIDSVRPSSARADTLDYPWANAPCEFGSAGESSCANPNNPNDKYDWGEYSGSTFEPYRNGYEYRNCTDYVQWKIDSLGGNVPGNLGNGGQWYDNAPARERSLSPQTGDAAVEPGTVGHVAFVESVNSVDLSNPDYDNITVSEYNEHEDGAGDYRTGTAASMGFTEFVDFGATTPPDPDSSTAAVQSNGGVLWTYNMNTGAGLDVNLPMASGTSPAISGSEVAVQSNGGVLWIYNMDTGVGTDAKLPMESGTSSAISGSEVAVQSNGGVLWTYNMNTGVGLDVNLPMASGTSPAISGSEVAVQSNGGVLWTYNMNTGAGFDVNLPMASGTSPAISGPEVAVQSNGGVLWTYNMNTGVGTDVNLPMAVGTSPSISGSEVAVQSNGGVLWTYNMDTGAGFDANLPMESGTSPYISGSEVAVQSNGGVLWTYNMNTGVGMDANLPMASGTSPVMP